jgi:hypothetical protein
LNSDDIRITNSDEGPQFFLLVSAGESQGNKITFTNTYTNVLITAYGPETDLGSGRIANWSNLFAINMTALGIESFTEEQMLDLVRSGYFEGLKSIESPKVESVGKNLFDVTEMYNPNALSSQIDFYNLQWGKTYKLTKIDSPSLNVRFYDSGGTQIGGTIFNVSSFSVPTGAVITNMYTNTFPVNPSWKYQLEEDRGQTLGIYEPYKSSQLTSDVPLRSLPNGVSDRVYESNGQMWLEKNIEEIVLQSSDVVSMNTTYSNLDYARISRAIALIGGVTVTSQTPIGSGLSGKYPTKPIGDYDNANHIGKIDFNADTTNVWVGFVKGTTLATAQADLAGTKIHYQLATPQLINLTEQGLTTGELLSFENGTVYQSSDTFHSPDISFDVPSNRSAQIDSLLQSVNAQSKQIDAKANKVQEEWVEPTLLNGWVNVSGVGVGYYKNTLGEVIIKGYITGGAVMQPIFYLPEGYRPPHDQWFIVYSNDSTVKKPSFIVVKSNGEVYADNGSITYRLSLTLPPFRAAE